MQEPAYEAGPTDVALLDETIPHNLTHTIEAHPQREALVSRHQGIRWSYEEFGHRVADLAKSLMHAGLERVTGSVSGRRTTPSGRSCSSPPPRSG